MASVVSQFVEEVTAHMQSDSLEDAREICADGTYIPNNLHIKTWKSSRQRKTNKQTGMLNTWSRKKESGRWHDRTWQHICVCFVFLSTPAQICLLESIREKNLHRHLTTRTGFWGQIPSCVTVFLNLTSLWTSIVRSHNAYLLYALCLYTEYNGEIGFKNNQLIQQTKCQVTLYTQCSSHVANGKSFSRTRVIIEKLTVPQVV